MHTTALTIRNQPLMSESLLYIRTPSPPPLRLESLHPSLIQGKLGLKAPQGNPKGTMEQWLRNTGLQQGSPNFPNKGTVFCPSGSGVGVNKAGKIWPVGVDIVLVWEQNLIIGRNSSFILLVAAIMATWCQWEERCPIIGVNGRNSEWNNAPFIGVSNYVPSLVAVGGIVYIVGVSNYGQLLVSVGGNSSLYHWCRWED